MQNTYGHTDINNYWDYEYKSLSNVFSDRGRTSLHAMTSAIFRRTQCKIAKETTTEHREEKISVVKYRQHQRIWSSMSISSCTVLCHLAVSNKIPFRVFLSFQGLCDVLTVATQTSARWGGGGSVRGPEELLQALHMQATRNVSDHEMIVSTVNWLKL